MRNALFNAQIQTTVFLMGYANRICNKMMRIIGCSSYQYTIIRELNLQLEIVHRSLKL